MHDIIDCALLSLQYKLFRTKGLIIVDRSHSTDGAKNPFEASRTIKTRAPYPSHACLVPSLHLQPLHRDRLVTLTMSTRPVVHMSRKWWPQSMGVAMMANKNTLFVTFVDCAE